MKKTLVKFFALSLLAFATPASANNIYVEDGDYWRRTCNSNQSVDTAECIGFVQGFLAGIEVQKSATAGQVYCLPRRETLTTGMDVFRAALAMREMRSERGDYVLFAALLFSHECGRGS